MRCFIIKRPESAFPTLTSKASRTGLVGTRSPSQGILHANYPFGGCFLAGSCCCFGWVPHGPSLFRAGSELGQPSATYGVHIAVRFYDRDNIASDVLVGCRIDIAGGRCGAVGCSQSQCIGRPVRVSRRSGSGRYRHRAVAGHARGGPPGYRLALTLGGRDGVVIRVTWPIYPRSIWPFRHTAGQFSGHAYNCRRGYMGAAHRCVSKCGGNIRDLRCRAERRGGGAGVHEYCGCGCGAP